MRCTLFFFVMFTLSVTFAASAVAQVALNANPLDTFPANSAALATLAEKDPLIATAIESFKAGNAEKLKTDLAAAKAANANLPKVDVMIARMLMASTQWSDALAVLENHVASNAADAEAHKSFAEIAMVSGRWTDAWLHIEKAAALIEAAKFSDSRKKDFSTELLKLRGEVAERRKDTATATKSFESLAKLQPGDGYPFWALGRMKVAAGDVDAGFELLKKGKSLKQDLPQPELAIAVELIGRSEREAAEKWLRSGLTNKETSSEANWAQYIQFLVDADRAAAAKLLLDKLPAAYQSNRDFKLLRAVVHRHLGESAEAEKLLSDLHRANPDDLDAADHLALVLVESDDEGKRARAQQISEANLRQAPNQERLAATAAWVKFKTGSADVADNLLGQVVRGGRISPQTAYYSAMILKSRGRPTEAAQFLKMAVEAPGTFPQKQAAKAELAATAK